MSAALLLLRDSDGGGELPPLVAWELFMRGAGRSERTVRDGVATMQRLERNAGKGCDQLAPVDVSRFLADPPPRSVVAGGLLRFDQRVLSLVGNARRHEHHCPAAVAALAEAIAAAGVGAGPIMKQYVAVLKDPI